MRRVELKDRIVQPVSKEKGVSSTVCVDDWRSYESTLSKLHRNREGVYYTPESVVDDLFAKVGEGDFSDKLFLDPCCGSGNFLIKALEMGFLPHNVYGFDVDPTAVAIAKRRVNEISGYDPDNIRCVDFLSVADSLTLTVDYIVTNPPWGRKIDRAEREKLAKRYDVGRSSDSSSLFLSASLRLLREGGVIGFLMQEAFFNIGIYCNIRSKIFELRIDHLVDYGRVFRGLLTKACALVATNVPHRGETINCHSSGASYCRSRASFECNPQLIFNLTTNRDEADVIEMVMNRPHITLRDSARWGMGIVTGDNRRFCSDLPEGRKCRPIYRGADITSRGFREPSLYIDSDLSMCQQVAPLWMYDAPCKIVYKFITSRLCFLCDEDRSLILNSANMFVLNDDFPISSVELAKFLNSDFTNWLFAKIFSTRKVLRSNLESIPIFEECFVDGEFSEDQYLAMLNVERSLDGSYRMIGRG